MSINYMSSSLYKVTHKDYNSLSRWYHILIGMVLTPIIYPILIFGYTWSEVKHEHRRQRMNNDLQKLINTLDHLTKEHKHDSVDN